MIIDKFLGVRYSLTGDTALALGEFSDCKNISITSDYKARKRGGYKSIGINIPGSIRGQWRGLIGGIQYHIFAVGGHVYKRTLGVATDLGVLTDAPTMFFYFGVKLYIVNGYEYKSFDGANLVDVVGYIPKIAISTKPTGGGDDHEGINLLTGKKHQTFRSDGTVKVYTLREQAITSVDSVYLNGVLKTVTTDYTVDLVTGKVTFVLQPPNWEGAEDDVDIYWTKGAGSRSEVLGYTKVMLYGGKNDTRVFLYGNGTNKMHFSALANGIPSAEYFPALNYSSVGSTEFHITDVQKQYDRQIIFTTQGAYYSVYDYDETLMEASLPIYPLNDVIGNIPIGQGQTIENNPFTITTGVYKWVSTNVRDERNAVFMSERVQPLLDELDLSYAITYDYEDQGEHWLCIGKKIFIYNYLNDTWYIYELAHTPTSFITIDGVLFMGTNDGKIMEWSKYNINSIPEYLTDDGIKITAYIETGFMDFGISWKRKFLNFAWIGIKPESKSVCFVEWESDYDASAEAIPIYYSLIDFGNIDFADFSFQVNYNPQPFRLKLKAKKFTFFKLILSNDSETETMTILNINLPVSVGGVSK